MAARKSAKKTPAKSARRAGTKASGKAGAKASGKKAAAKAPTKKASRKAASKRGAAKASSKSRSTAKPAQHASRKTAPAKKAAGGKKAAGAAKSVAAGSQGSQAKHLARRPDAEPVAAPQTAAATDAPAHPAAGGVSSLNVNLGHVFALRPRVETSFRQADFRTARQLLQDESYGSLEEAARAVAEKALELTHAGPAVGGGFGREY